MTRLWAQLPPAALALLAGSLVSLSARPGSWGWLAFGALVPLMAALDREAKPNRMALWTATVGASVTALGAAGVYQLSRPAFLLLIAGHALLFAVPGVLIALAVRGTGVPASILLPLARTATETVATSQQLLGQLASPVALGYLAARTPLIRGAGWSGVIGLTLLLLCLNLAIHRGIAGRWGVGAGVAGAVVATLFAPLGVTPTGTQSLALVQGANSDREVHAAGFDDRSRRALLARYARLSRQAAPDDLVVWPESSLPGIVATPDDEVRLSPFLPAAVALVSGIAFDGRHHYNSLFHWDGERLERVYDKQAPVPWFEGWLHPGSKSGVRRVNGEPIGLLICWESAFPDFARSAVRNGARALLVASNDTVIAGSATAHWHTQATRVRAAETGRAVALASQSGPSMLIAADGRVLASTRAGERTVLRGALPTTAGSTPFTRYGNWLGWLCVASVAGRLLCTRSMRAGAADL